MTAHSLAVAGEALLLLKTRPVGDGFETENRKEDAMSDLVAIGFDNARKAFKIHAGLVNRQL